MTPAKNEQAAVRLDKLTKRFGSNVAVREVTLSIATGAVYGLIGPNGAGKTTTFSMLAGFLRPTVGEVEVLGRAPTDVVRLRGRIGVLPQDALLPPIDRVGEFLVHMARLQAIPAAKAADAARAVLAEVDGKDWWNERCGRLSHGMAKRVALAQALLGEPEVVLLDEPTAGLDPRVAVEVRQIIASRKGRSTVIISSHNLHELEEICDGAAILDRGRLVASGNMNELTASSEEVHILVAAPLQGAPVAATTPLGVPVQAIGALAFVKSTALDEETGDLAVYFERHQIDAEGVIGHVLSILLAHNVRISGVTKGRGLERRVMDLTRP